MRSEKSNKIRGRVRGGAEHSAVTLYRRYLRLQGVSSSERPHNDLTTRVLPGQLISVIAYIVRWRCEAKKSIKFYVVF